MFRKVNRLIFFLVLATMSLRGMAAVDMWHCAHHQGGAIFAASVKHAGHQHLHGDAVAAHAAHHADHAGHDSSAHPNPASGNPVDDSASQLGAHCISSVLAPVERIVFSFAPVGTSRIPFIELRFVGVVPAQPDRPPLVRSL